MASTTEIANLALSHLGMGVEIASLDTEKSAEAMACRRFYDTARQEVLRDFAWPFATAFATLGLLGSSPTEEWAYSYGYPSDCLEFRRIVSGTRNDTHQSRIPYRIVYGASARAIYCDRANAQAEYTADVSETGRYPADFVNALALRLAVYVAPRLTAGDPFKVGARAAQLYSMAITKAQANAANEEQVENLPESEFIRARE